MSALFIIVYCIAVLCLLFSFEDILFDFVALLKRSKPESISPAALEELSRRPQKNMAIMIANWKESGVLKRMILGNLAQIQYRNYYFFLGVYPNDHETKAEARELATHYPHVVVVENKFAGPTSKAQMLNEIVRGIFDFEKKHQIIFDAFLLHDSEDVIHAHSLTLINEALNEADYVQIPVFSLNTSLKDITGGIYQDEFAEIHTKDLILRSQVGAPVPSAGVGTAIGRKVILALAQKGSVFEEKSLTEDYRLGFFVYENKFKAKFLCVRTEKDFIATKEFFPKSVKASVRQKTRWVFGIVYQSREKITWKWNEFTKQNLAYNYFLFRDRKAPLNALLVFSSGLIFSAFTYTKLFYPETHIDLSAYYFAWVLKFNGGAMLVRGLQKARHTYRVHGKKALLLLPVRWVWSNTINPLASFHAFRMYLATTKESRGNVAWIKTMHELPVSFGEQPVGAMPAFSLLQRPQALRNIPLVARENLAIEELAVPRGETPVPVTTANVKDN